MDDILVTPTELGIPDTFPLPRRTDWRIGMIGYGGVAMAHTEAYLPLGWKIVAVADPLEEARARAADRNPGVRLYPDFPELIRDENVEIVVLLTQPTIRDKAVRLAAEVRKPVLVEKPLAMDLEECERMIARMDGAGVPFAVSQNYRWDGVNFHVHHLVRKGYIGESFFASIEIEGSQDVGVAPHPFYSKCEDFLTVQWNNHLADLLRYWLGRETRRVFTCTRRMKGQNFVSDNLLLSMIDFGEGVTGHILHHELLRSRLEERKCRVDGNKGSLWFPLNGSVLRLHSELLGPEIRFLDIGPWNNVFSFAGPMADLLTSIEEGREPSTSARNNLATMRHVLADRESSRKGGQWIDCVQSGIVPV